MYFDYLNFIAKYVALIIFGALPEGMGHVPLSPG
jgi:hypothetical protein